LGRDGPEILFDYPATQAALARVVDREDGQRVAERFEVYWRGVELANGYHELTDATELRRRLTAVNDARAADGRQRLPLPESLLSAMERGLPDCTGCALGFDRLAMLATGAGSIDEVMAFPGDVV
jgi:lysyl-tRNA synthetase class 2